MELMVKKKKKLLGYFWDIFLKFLSRKFNVWIGILLTFLG